MSQTDTSADRPENNDTGKTAADFLEEFAELFREKNAGYGDSYKKSGYILDILFPMGINLSGVQDFNRFCIFVHILNKLLRYASSFNEGGHKDSSEDLSVYAAMLREMTVGSTIKEG